jgi:hypothetical protein
LGEAPEQLQISIIDKKVEQVTVYPVELCQPLNGGLDIVKEYYVVAINHYRKQVYSS